jgi:phosphoglycerate dehydrogenase-like enzyme
MTQALINIELPEKHINYLRQTYSQIQFTVCTDRQKVYDCLKNAEIFLIFFLCTKRMLDAAPNLKWVQAISAGVDYIATDEIRQRGILLTNGRGISKIHMAEYAIAAMINLSRNLHATFRNQIEKKWVRDVPQGEIFGATLGILGMGAIGSEIAKRAAVMGMRVVGVQRTPRETAYVDKVYGPDEMHIVFKESDYIINLLPHTSATEKLIDKRYFDLMKPTAGFINIGRGKTVNEPDLIEALENKTFKAMVSDVFYDEPLSEQSPLWELDNVIITPHVCGASTKYIDRAMEIIDHNLQVYVSRAGEMMNVVDPSLGY